MMKLIEECSGVGQLVRDGAVLQQVRYAVTRYQGMHDLSGLPIPGLHRVEGAIECDPGLLDATLLDTPLTLKLEDGRAIGIVVADRTGRVLSEGHGPSRCLCC